MTQHPAIEISNLIYDYPDGTRAINGLSLRVAEGEKIAIVGPNGAGKSTLLLHLNGILTGQGVVHICGLSLNKKNLPQIRQFVGMVFQNPDDQLFCPTVYDDIAFGPRNMGLPEDEVGRRVERSLAAVSLTGLHHKSAFHLSVGQKKRVATATVLAMDCRILALDEPTSSLDPRGRKEIRQLLAGINLTQIMVTHDLNLARTLCDRVLVLEKGTIIAEGPPNTVLADPEFLEAHSLE